MKLSEMDTRQLAKALCEIAKPMDALGKSKALNEALKEYAELRQTEHATMLEQLTTLLSAIMPALLCDENLPNVAAIVAALSDKTPRQVLEQKGMQTIADIMNLADKDLADFFTQSVRRGQTKS